jgi:hypothetical protein
MFSLSVTNVAFFHYNRGSDYGLVHWVKIMQPILITTVVDEKRRIMIDLPDDVPTGEIRIEVVIHSQTQADEKIDSREWVQAKLRAAGLLVEYDDDYAEAEELSLEEEERLSYLFSTNRTTLDDVNQDRKERT